MKKLVLLTALLAIVALPAFAVVDNYHYNTSMKCSDCHSMHASSHENLPVVAGMGAGITTPGAGKNEYYFPAALAPQHYLLKNTDVCASCHKDQTFAPDVVGDNVNGYVRSAGGVKEAGETTGGGHVIGTTTRPPGYAATADINGYFAAGAVLECYSCHSPHGGSNFRNLVPYQMRSAIGSTNAPAVGPTVAKTAAFDGTKDVTIIGADSYAFGTPANFSNYYGRDKVVYANNQSVTFNGTTSTNRMDQFCGVCHGAFHGGSIADTGSVGDTTTFVRHPTSTVTIGAAPTSYLAAANQAFANLKVYQATGTATRGTDSPGCLTCHKAHGNNNPFALIFPGTTAADTTEEGAGVYKNLCKTCHSMGGTM
jgi:hypothetical protein